jgi:hypothetical protein
MATYITSNGSVYEFSFETQADGTLRAYIVVQPSYGEKAASLPATGRIRDSSGRYYISWTKPLHQISEAKTVAAAWANRTDRYIYTGTPLSAPATRSRPGTSRLPVSSPARDEGYDRPFRGGHGAGSGRARHGADPFGIFRPVPKIDLRSSNYGGSDG